jgi:hypothetical protein
MNDCLLHRSSTEAEVKAPWVSEDMNGYAKTRKELQRSVSTAIIKVKRFKWMGVTAI